MSILFVFFGVGLVVLLVLLAYKGRHVELVVFFIKGPKVLIFIRFGGIVIRYWLGSYIIIAGYHSGTGRGYFRGRSFLFTAFIGLIKVGQAFFVLGRTAGYII